MRPVRDAPDSRDLIATAREALKAVVLPHLDGERAYAARMAVNALGIATRQLKSGAPRRAAALAALRPFAEGATLDAVAADLARRIRGGEVALSAELHAALTAVARSEAEESAPGARILKG